MIHKGLSGFAVELKNKGREVHKWTTGADSAPRLQESYLKQFMDMGEHALAPILPVEIISSYREAQNNLLNDDYTIEYCSFTMPFYDIPSGFTIQGGSRINMLNQILMSFRNRSGKVDEGFKGIITRTLKGLPDSDYKTVVEAKLLTCPDFYPVGYAHGDFGFANMLVSETTIYMVDYTRSFIESPLMDLATMELSCFSEHTLPFHREICKQVRSQIFYQFQEQTDILKMVKVLTYDIHLKEGERLKELKRMFYGANYRSPNL